MSYNNSRNYNTRNSGRFNRPGSFVPASPTLANHQTYDVPMQPPPMPPPPRAPELPPAHSYDNSFKQDEDTDMAASDTAGDGAEQASNDSRPPFLRAKLAGVKKISNKERRRRQNALLRRLTSPKNALMCINEMLPNEQVNNQFKVEPAPQDSNYYNHGAHNFRAELALDGVTYKGYGENKLAARNAAAEQAIRDIVLKKMERYSESMATQAANAPALGTDGSGAGAGGAGADKVTQAVSAMMEEEGEALPMIQLLSFALHKLFAEWEGAGHHVPQLRAQKPSQSIAEDDGSTKKVNALPEAAVPKVKKPKPVPENASSMHPSNLLVFLRPNAVYREVQAEGDKPQNMIFTMAVDTDDDTYIGRATNKKEARKQAARAACKGILGITFDDEKLGIPTLTTK